ncbi:MAG: phage major capsid protein, partial [Planctomycetes bacterium]|nr:phage major capsid protein [Planctomycetota bacterium]
MAWQQIKRLNEERGQIVADMKAILNKAQDEKRDLSADENAKFDEMSAKAEAKLAESQRHQKLYDMEQSGKGKGEQRQQPGREATNTDEQRTEAEAKEQRAAFDAYLRRGAVPQDGEHRSLTTSGAGVVGDRPVYDQLVVSLKSFAGNRMAGATVLPTTDGNDLSVPKSDDTSNEGQIVGEGSEDTTEANPTVGVITLKAYKHDSKWIRISLEMLQDSAFPIEQHILNIAGERIGRTFNGYATTGTGTGQPKGILVAGTLGKTAADDAAITYEEMLDLIHSVDAGYRNLP